MSRVRVLRLTAVLVTAVLLAGCINDDENEDVTLPRPPSATPQPPPPPPEYQVPDSACPPGWSGLVVTTADEAEVEYLDDIPACTNVRGDATYLANRSTAVWTLNATTQYGGTMTRTEQSLPEYSFLLAVAEARGGRPILVPGAAAVIDLPPESVEWVIDVPLSFGWEAHGLVLDEIKSAGEVAAVAALRRQSAAGAALGTCAFAAVQYADSVRELEEAAASDVLLEGLGLSTAYNACRTEAAAVTTVDEAGRPIALSDQLARLRSRPAALQTIETHLSYAQRAARALRLGLSFAR